MAKIEALFWDNGGVILTNGWDREARKRAAEKFITTGTISPIATS